MLALSAIDVSLHYYMLNFHRKKKRKVSRDSFSHGVFSLLVEKNFSILTATLSAKTTVLYI